MESTANTVGVLTMKDGTKLLVTEVTGRYYICGKTWLSRKNTNIAEFSEVGKINTVFGGRKRKRGEK